jgi:hypothetical protein
MADNFSFTEGSGKTGAADDIGGGVLAPRVKVGWGTDGTLNDTDTAAGKALPVQLRDSTGTEIALATQIGAVGETAPASDTASSGLNGRLQRIAQRITSLIALLPVSLGQKAKAAAFPVTLSSDEDIITNIGAVNETAPASDTASSGLNGRLQRIAQRITTLIGSTIATSVADGSNVTIGSKADAKSPATDTTSVSIMSVLKQISASVQAAAASLAGTIIVATHAVTQSGAWTVATNADAAIAAGAAPSKALVGGAVYNSTEISPTTGQTFALQADSKGRLRLVIMDAAGNTRGVNVNASNQLSVSVDNTVTVGSHAVTNAGTFPVQENGAALTSLQLIDDMIIADDAPFTPATSKVSMSGFQADETATDSVDEGDAGAARMTLDRKIIVTDQPHTAGGLSMSKTVSAATTNATSVKASAGKVYAIQASNVNAAARYLKLYNKASAPTVGTDTPVKTLIIPGNTAGAGTNIVFPTGIEFTTGIAFALTVEATDAGTTAVAANELVINIDYK